MAQAVAQAQGMDGAQDKGGSGGREAGRELWCRENSGHDSEWDGNEEGGGGGGGGGGGRGTFL